MEFLTARDIEILELMSVFGGKTYIEVLEKTFWVGHKNAKIQARNRMTILLKKYGLFLYKLTGLTSPRSAWALSEAGKDIVRTMFNKNITNISVSPVTTQHNIMEQITYYWLKKLGKNPERTVVSKWSKNHKHTPDIAYETEKGVIYVEIEKNLKAAGEYNTIFSHIVQDKVFKVLYVVESQKRVEQFANNLPLSEKIMLVSTDTLVAAAQSGKIGAISQKEARTKSIKG